MLIAIFEYTNHEINVVRIPDKMRTTEEAEYWLHDHGYLYEANAPTLSVTIHMVTESVDVDIVAARAKWSAHNEALHAAEQKRQQEELMRALLGD